MAREKVKVSELPAAASLAGLWALGLDGSNRSVRVSLAWLKEASENLGAIKDGAVKATGDADTATAASIAATRELRELQATLSDDYTLWGDSYSRWAAAEQARRNEELGRAADEAIRVQREATRVKNEDARIVEEELRKRAEAGRSAAELIRLRQEETRERETVEALLAVDGATDRLNALSDHRDKIIDGFWWRWNELAGAYENTGNPSKGNVMFASFDVDPSTMELSMLTDEEYTGAGFSLDNGYLSVII